MSDEIKKLKAEIEALKGQIGGIHAVKEAEQLQISREERKAKAARLKNLKQIRPAKMEALLKEWCEADQRVKEAQENLKKVQGEFPVADGKLFAEGWQLDQKIRELESFLHRTASADLKRALERAKDTLEETRSLSLEPIILPIPTGMGVPLYDSEGNTRMSEGGPGSWWRRHVGKTPRELRQEEMDEITQEIKAVEQQVLGGE